MTVDKRNSELLKQFTKILKLCDFARKNFTTLQEKYRIKRLKKNKNDFRSIQTKIKKHAKQY